MTLKIIGHNLYLMYYDANGKFIENGNTKLKTIELKRIVWQENYERHKQVKAMHYELDILGGLYIIR